MVRLLGVGVAMAAAVNFMVLFGSIPATQAELRKASVFGDWRLETGAALFDQGTYLFQLGYGMVNAGVENPGAQAGEDPLTMFGTRATSAIEYLNGAIEVDPGNAHAWTALAWAHSLKGDMAAARAAMAISWEIAPYNYALSQSRSEFYAMVSGMSGTGMIFPDETLLDGDDALGDIADLDVLGEELGDLEGMEGLEEFLVDPPSEVETAAVRRDLQIMDLHARRNLNQLLEVMPVLTPLAPPPAEG